MSSPRGATGKSRVQFRTMSSDQQAQHLRQRAKILREKKQRTQIIAVMQQYPEHLQEIQEVLEGHGFVFDCDDKVPPKRMQSSDSLDGVRGEPEEQVKVEQQDEEARSETGGTGSEVPDGASRTRTSCGIKDDNVQNWIPHKYTRFDNSSAVFLVSLLSQVEPVSMSSLALQPVVAKGKKEAKIAKLCEHLEFATGVSRETGLTGEKRHIPTLVTFLKTSSVQEGRRARDLQVPGRWGGKAGDDGNYEIIKHVLDIIGVRDRFTGVEHMIPDEDRLKYKDGTNIEFDDLDIEFNYSAEKARVFSAACSTTIHILPLGHWGRKGKRLAQMTLAASALVEKPAATVSPSKREQDSAEKQESPLKKSKVELAEGVADNQPANLAPVKQEADWQPPPPGDSGVGIPVGASAGASPGKALQPRGSDASDLDDSALMTGLEVAMRPKEELDYMNEGENGVCSADHYAFPGGETE